MTFQSFVLSLSHPRLIWRLATWWQSQQRTIQLAAQKLPPGRFAQRVSPSTHPDPPNLSASHKSGKIRRRIQSMKPCHHLPGVFCPSIFFHGVCLAMPAFCDRKNSLIVLGSACDRFCNSLLCLAFVFWIHSHSTWDLWQFRSWRVFGCIWRSLLPSIGAHQSCDGHLTEFSCETLPLHLLFSVQTGNSLLIFTKSKRQSFCCAYCPRRALCGHRVQDTFYCWKASALVVWLISTVLTTTLWVGAQDTAREIPPHSAQMLWDCAYQTLSKQRAVWVVHGPWTTVISLDRVNIKSIPNAFLLLVRALDWMMKMNEIGVTRFRCASAIDPHHRWPGT